MAPLWLGLWLTDGHPVGATVVSIVLALVVGRVGAALWIRTEASQDLVFDDLLAWSFLRRLRSERALIENVRRLGLDVGASAEKQGLTRERQLKLFKVLAADLERGDQYTHGHSQRVARHADMIARAMQLPRKEREKVRLAALLHDVGKLRVPREVLNNPGRLTEAEFEVVKRHPSAGADMVEVLGDDELTAMIRYHHERIDGSGYPERRRAEEIPLGARIIAVADTFDAITSRRPYRAASRHKAAIEILQREAGRQLDVEVVHAFNAYYSGRRSIRWWFFLMAGWRHGLDALLVGLPRFGLVGVANAAAVGGAAVVFAAGAMMHGLVETERAQPDGRQRQVRESKRDGKKPPVLYAAGEASDGVSTSHARAASNDSNTKRSRRSDGDGTGRSGGERDRETLKKNEGAAADDKRPESEGSERSEEVTAASGTSTDGDAGAVKNEPGPAPAPDDAAAAVTDKVEDTAPEAPEPAAPATDTEGKDN